MTNESSRPSGDYSQDEINKKILIAAGDEVTQAARDAIASGDIGDC
jgi:hypothetical protein